MKQGLTVGLVLLLLIALFGCSGLASGDNPSNYPPEEEHTVIRTLEDGATTYFCWEDGIVTTKEVYKADSALYWENDTAEGAYLVRNSMGIVFMSYYVQPTQPTTEPTTPATEDPYQGHTLEGIVTDPLMGNTYYCWDDGNATTEEVYSVSGLTWTHPWNQNFFNIYNGHSDNGNVVYSEKACTWCGQHKVYYLSYVRDAYDYSKGTEYHCESCHIDLTNNYKKCAACGCYYSNYWIVDGGNGYFYCEPCWAE